MKIAVLIIAILGSLAALGLGVKYLSDFNKYKETFAVAEQVNKQVSQKTELSDALKEVNKLKYAAYALIACGLISMVAVFLMAKLGKLASVIFILSAVIPAIFYPGTLVFTFLLALAGILAFFVKPKQA